jgi:hypothetical protein
LARQGGGTFAGRLVAPGGGDHGSHDDRGGQQRQQRGPGQDGADTLPAVSDVHAADQTRINVGDAGGEVGDGLSLPVQRSSPAVQPSMIRSAGLLDSHQAISRFTQADPGGLGRRKDDQLC